MTRPGPASEEELYSSTGGMPRWSGHVNPALSFALPPGSDLTESCRTALDIGCGEGADAQWLATRHGLLVTGIDISPTAIFRARKTCPAVHRFLEGDWQEYVTKKGTTVFSVVTSFYVPIPNTSESVDTLLRAVAPGGRLILCHHLFPSRQLARLNWDVEDLFSPAQAWRVIASHPDFELVAVAGVTDPDLPMKVAVTLPDGCATETNPDTLLIAKKRYPAKGD